LIKRALLMLAKLSFALVCLSALIGQATAQEVIIAREEAPHYPKAEVIAHPQPLPGAQIEKASEAKSVKAQLPEKKVASSASAVGNVPMPQHKASPSPKGEGASQTIKPATVRTALKPIEGIRPTGVTSKASAGSASPSKLEADRPELKSASVKVARPTRLTVVEGPAGENHDMTLVAAPPANNHFDTAFIKLADGFDFPVGKPDAQGYYKARGFRSRGHLGEDWDGIRGGDTDLGDPIYSVGDGLVVFARDCHMGWGNVMIVRHSYREGGVVKTIDALYGHLNTMLVHRGQAVHRGQQIATMGTAHGLYDAHLHLEIRKNIEIGMSRTAFARDFTNYYDPTQFIVAHRHLSSGGGTYRVAMNTFVRDANINFDKVRNYSHSRSGGGTRESSAALKKAIASRP
jgi:murein DD-endopeptidase MepM/ murein hydrolase activator NlpD